MGGVSWVFIVADVGGAEERSLEQVASLNLPQVGKGGYLCMSFLLRCRATSEKNVESAVKIKVESDYCDTK